MSFIGELQGRLSVRKAIVDAQIDGRIPEGHLVSLPNTKKTPPPVPPKKRNIPPRKTGSELDDILSHLEQLTNSLDGIPLPEEKPHLKK